MTDRELAFCQDGTLVFDKDREMYGVVTDEYIEEQSDWLRIRWENDVTETIPFVQCRSIIRVNGGRTR